MKLKLPTTPLGWAARGGVSAVIAAIGVCLALGCDHYWQSKIPSVQIVGGGYPPITAPTFNSISGDLLFGPVPFFALAAVTFLFGARLFAIVSVGLLAALTVWEYRTNAHDTSSTGGLVFLWSWFGGVPLAVAAGVADTLRPWLKPPDERRAPGVT